MVQEGVKLKYGHIKGAAIYLPAPMGASEVIKAASGRFGRTDGSGRIEIAPAAETQLDGFVELAEQTCSATEGATIGSLIPACCPCIYRIPIDTGTYVAGMRYDTCDLGVTSDIQGADLTASTTDVIIIMDGDLVNNNWVDVMINPNKIGAQAV